MADFAPPAGPPPPKVPAGYKAVWNEQYSEYFYVNIYTKKSQWDKPTEPVYPPGEGPPDGPPPSYTGGPGAHSTSTEKSNLTSNNPYAQQPDISEDERYARQLQEEEQARARSHGDSAGAGAANAYYNSAPTGYPNPGGSSSAGITPGYGDASSQDRGKSKGGLLGKLLGKAGGSSSHQQQGGYAGYPQQQGYPQQGYGGYGQPMGGGYGGGMYGRPQRKTGGMGAGGAAALGVGGGLLGGMMLGEALGDAGDGGDGGGDYGGDGGDFGGGDMGGGDF